MSFVEDKDFYEFKDEVRKAINELEKETTEKIHGVEIANEKMVGLLASIDLSLKESKKNQEEQSSSQKAMENRMDEKLDKIDESIGEVNKSVNGHSISIAVLQENSMKQANPNSGSNSSSDVKKLSIMTEYRKWWIGGIIGFATTVGVAMMNNAENILKLFGIVK